MKKVEVESIKVEKWSEPAERMYSEMEVIDILHKNLKPVSAYVADKVVGSNKYVHLATDYGYSHYRMCSVQDLKRLGVFDSLSFYRKNFFTENGAVVAIFNEMNDRVASVVFRSLSTKAFMDYSIFYTAYGFNLMRDDFRYGDPVILTEGIYDADSVRPLFQDVLAMLTSNITIGQAEVLKTLTDNFIVLFDSDEAGMSGYKTAMRRLLGSKVQMIQVFKGDKDVGEMEEYRKAGKLSEYAERRDFYKEQIDSSVSGFQGVSVFDL